MREPRSQAATGAGKVGVGRELGRLRKFVPPRCDLREGQHHPGLLREISVHEQRPESGDGQTEDDGHQREQHRIFSEDAASLAGEALQGSPLTAN